MIHQTLTAQGTMFKVITSANSSLLRTSRLICQVQQVKVFIKKVSARFQIIGKYKKVRLNVNMCEVKSCESVNLSTVNSVKSSVVSVVLGPPSSANERPQRGEGVQTEAPPSRFAEQSRQLKIIQSGCCPQNPRKFLLTLASDDSDRVMIGQ